MDRRHFLAAVPAALMAGKAMAAAPASSKGVMLMNRIGPSSSELYIANADGSNERKLLQGASVFEYHASFGPDGKSVIFTSERLGDGQSDLFRANLDGSGIQPLVVGSAVDDSGELSPDGSRLAFVSTRQGYVANVWILDLKTKRLTNLTGAPEVQGDPSLPNGFFRPAWSPDGKQIAFSSDRNTDWRGHHEGKGWEHTQELSIYVIGADGKGLRRVASKPGYCLGSPKWSPDGKRVAFYELTTEDTWFTRRPDTVGGVTSQIVSVDVATGERVELTSGPGFKLFPQFLSDDVVAYQRKGGPEEGLYTTDGKPPIKRVVRSPVWSPDGKSVIYEKVGFKARGQFKPLYSWDPKFDYLHTDVFPVVAGDGTLAITEKQQGNSSLVTMNRDGSNRRVVFEVEGRGLDPVLLKKGLAGAFMPGWSPDGQWLTFGMGVWFQERTKGKATLMRVRRDGTDYEPLTDGTVHSGFPSYSADGKEIVFRVWGESEKGLRVINLDTRQIRVLTTGYDNLPFWSPDGKRIVFTRKVDAVNFDVFTIRPDGSDLQRLTTNRGNDGHAVWSADGRILFSTGMYGFREEAALYDNTFQPYGQIMVMNADGTGKRLLTDSLWEDSMPMYLPAK
ncbi:PD40 domain-containing protein [Caulobacter hibisci]|uniref:PD40 domain-containing protein n=1 Tax=Caulobacter hibisci TaxID=2035993 RepID=A0ABS0SXC2_9CAUL|nr:PD40 domain-containing protein [Caulobacter hibisci]MBI1684297.1 PD40 domain-containing protein [Caulobacter hibisci]